MICIRSYCRPRNQSGTYLHGVYRVGETVIGLRQGWLFLFFSSYREIIIVFVGSL